MASKVYTKKGDKGCTMVMGCQDRLPKCNPRIEAIGGLDELNSYVGLIRSYKVVGNDVILEQIQNDLFIIGARLADTREDIVMTISTDILESSMDIMSKSIPPLKNFILPAGPRDVCYCHIARTTCRRAERTIVKLARSEEGAVDPVILGYINRLSDYFFVLSRFLSHAKGIPETIWSG